MAGGRKCTNAFALLAAAVVACLAAVGIFPHEASSQSATPEFADWTAVNANVASGTLLGAPISLSGTHVSDAPASTVNGTSPTFNEPSFSPPLLASDAIEFQGFAGFSYTLQFGAPVENPILHLDSLGSTLTFPVGTQITKLSGEVTFTVAGNVVAGVPDGLADDASGTVVLSGSFESLAFSAEFAGGSPDGIYLQVGALPPADTAPPETTITAGPAGLIQDRTPTFSFASNESRASFRCRVDGVPVGACVSPFTTAALDAGPHRFEVEAVDPAGNVDLTAARRDVRIAARLADLPAPVLSRSINVAPLSGRVLVGVRAGVARTAQKGLRFVPLEEARQIPVGSFLQTRRGTVRLLSARDARGRRQSGDFTAGLFQVLQSRRRSARGLTELRLKGSSFRGCGPRAGRREVRGARVSRRTIRRLRARARGRFRTRGRYSSATVRGTDWTVTDRCDGTLTKVKRGSVTVRDFRRRKTVTVRAGRRYLARAPR